MNDNLKWNLLGGGFKVLGVVFFVGAIAGGIWQPSMWWALMGILGFAMVMV